VAYNPAWELLLPCNLKEFVDRVNLRGFGVKHTQSPNEASVHILERQVNGAPVFAVLSPGVSDDRHTTVVYLCERLQIPKDVFGL
jgi:putative NADPH-quinone reductase